MVPLSSTARHGMNFKVAGFGVASVWMNIACSGVAGSRPARERSLSDGDAGCTVKGRRPDPQSHQGPTTVGPYDSASISSSLKSPGTMLIGIGNEPTVLAMMVMSGPGRAGPGLAARA